MVAAVTGLMTLRLAERANDNHRECQEAAVARDAMSTQQAGIKLVRFGESCLIVTDRATADVSVPARGTVLFTDVAHRWCFAVPSGVAAALREQEHRVR